MIGESSHSNSTASPQYEDIIQELSSICLDVSRERKNKEGHEEGFFSGCLGSHAYLQYSIWKTLRKSHQDEGNEDEEDETFLLLAKAATLECLERLSDLPSRSLSIWTNPVYGTHVLLSLIYHQLQLGEASYQQLDHVEDFLEHCIADFGINKDPVESYNVRTGLAGTLQGIFFLRRELQRPDWAKKDAIRIALELLKQGQRLSSASKNSSAIPLYWGDENGDIDWSISTGTAGILQTLLGLELNEWNEIDKEIPNALESLLERSIHQLPSYGKLEFYSRNTNNVSWTLDGAAGHVILLLQAYVVLGSIDYLHQARRLVKTVIFPRYALCLKDLAQVLKEPLGLFDGLIGVCYSLWLIKERDAARKLTEVAIEHCKRQIQASDTPLDISLAQGVTGLIRLLQQLDSPCNGNGDEMEVPFLSSALFNFVLQKKKPLQDSDADTGSWIRRKKKWSGVPMASLSATEDDSGHQSNKYYLSDLPISKRRASVSDLDEDSHVSFSSFSVDEMQGYNSAPQYQKEKRLKSKAIRQSSIARSVSSSSFSLKDSLREEDEDDSSTSEHLVVSNLLPKYDGSDGSSSFSTSSHMENATVEEQADPNYLAKQDSDNEEYVYANQSISLLPGKRLHASDSDSTKGKKPPKALPIDRLALFAKSRRMKPSLLQVDSDSDSIGEDAKSKKRTPSVSIRKALMVRSKPRVNVGDDSSDDESSTDLFASKGSTPSRSNRQSLLARPGPGILQKHKSVKRKSLLDEEGHGSDLLRLDDCYDIDKEYEDLQDAGVDAKPDNDYLKMQDSQNIEYFNISNTKTKAAAVQRKTLLDEEGHKPETIDAGGDNDDADEDDEDDDSLNDPGSHEKPNPDYLARQDSDKDDYFLTESTTKQPAIQKKTLLDEEGHSSSCFLVLDDEDDDHRNLKNPDSQEMTNSKNLMRQDAEAINDDDEFNDDDLAIGLPTEQPDEAYLDTQDISSRTRTFDPYSNYKPVSVQRKTLMDEEGHGEAPAYFNDKEYRSVDSVPQNEEEHRLGNVNTQFRSPESLLDDPDVDEEGYDSAASMNDDDEFNDDDLAIGLPTEQPDEAYLDTQDISSRTRTFDPYSNYKPVSVQRKTLMDEEGHGEAPAYSNDEEFGSVDSLPQHEEEHRLGNVNTQFRSPESLLDDPDVDEEGYDSGSASMNDDDEFNDDDLAIGLPTEQPDEAYLDTQDISSRTRTFDPYSNYKPVSVQRKTLMDEEGHGEAPAYSNDEEFRSVDSLPQNEEEYRLGDVNTQFRSPESLLDDPDVDEEGYDSGSASMNDEFNDDDLAIGLPTEQPDEAYLDTQDISSRTRTFDPYSNYKPVSVQRKTLMDEEGHGEAPAYFNDEEFRSVDSMHQDSDIEEEPNAEYLAKQDSSMDMFYEYKSTTTIMPSHGLLDEEEHQLDHANTQFPSSESLLDESDAEDEPNAEYLAKQDSATNLYYEFSSETTKMPVHQILDEEKHIALRKDNDSMIIEGGEFEAANDADMSDAAYLESQV